MKTNRISFSLTDRSKTIININFALKGIRIACLPVLRRWIKCNNVIINIALFTYLLKEYFSASGRKMKMHFTLPDCVTLPFLNSFLEEIKGTNSARILQVTVKFRASP